MPKIFISHAVKDKAVAHMIHNLISNSYDIDQNDIFCSSLDGALEGGKPFVDGIKQSFNESTLVILLLSKNYFLSEFCLSELGASWVNKPNILPAIMPPEDFDCFKGVLTGLQGLFIDSDSFIIDLCKKITEWKKKQEPNGNLLEPQRQLIEKQSKMATSQYNLIREDIIDACKKIEKERRGIEYDVFISSPMSYKSDAEFYEAKTTVKVAIEALKKCKPDLTYHYAGDNFNSLSEFQTARDSAEDDLSNIDKSEIYLMILPDSRITSCHVEAGYAIAKGKKTIFIVKSKSYLPFILKGVDSAYGIGTRVYEYSSDENLTTKILSNKGKIINGNQ